MAKYLFYGSYTPEGLNGLMKEGGSSRIEAAKEALGSGGGSWKHFILRLVNTISISLWICQTMSVQQPSHGLETTVEPSQLKPLCC